MMKVMKRLTTAIATAAVLILLFLPGSALGQTSAADDVAVIAPVSREEVVYANLTTSGQAKDVYVVAILHTKDTGMMTDFGDYASVKNLTDTAPLTLTQDRVSAVVPAGDYYYQGNLTTVKLPWNISVTYYLDGSEITPDALAGSSGHVTIKVRTDRNPDVDSIYFDNYMLQISMTLDTSKCAGITAPGATVAIAGVSKRINFAVMPGKAGDMTIETDAVDFAMAGIEIAALPLSMHIDPPDTSAMKGDLTKLSDAVSELNDGIAQLEDGAIDLKSGADDLKGGSSSFAAGLHKLYINTGGLVGGSAQIKDALSSIAASMSASGGQGAALDLGSLQQLPDGLTQLAAGLDGISSGLTDLSAGFDASYGALKAAILEIPNTPISESEWGRLYQDNPDKKGTLDSLSAYYAAAMKTKATFDNVRPFFDAVHDAMGQLIASTGQISGALKDTAGQIKGAIESNDALSQLSQLMSGLQALSVEYGDFHDGLISFTAGVSDLDKNYGRLDAGLSEFAIGFGDFSDGIGQTADGVSELNDGVKDLPSKTDEEIQKLMDAYDKSDVKPVSFASSKNVNTVLVQFVIKTDKIEKAEIIETIPEPEQKETIWDRFLNIFK